MCRRMPAFPHRPLVRREITLSGRLYSNSREVRRRWLRSGYSRRELAPVRKYRPSSTIRGQAVPQNKIRCCFSYIRIFIFVFESCIHLNRSGAPGTETGLPQRRVCFRHLPRNIDCESCLLPRMQYAPVVLLPGKLLRYLLRRRR